MKKVIFIDRDGSLIIEPPITEQVNSLEEMVFLPCVISSLKRLYDAGFELVMVTNQDGLGTKANPRDVYESINNKMFEIFGGEGIKFSKVFECPHLPKDNCNCRKPKVGILKDYLQKNQIDKNNSFVIGDRESDMQFAKNLGIQGLQITKKIGWKEIADQILKPKRVAEIKRETKETKICVKLDLDGEGKYEIDTGVKFFDHMLEQLGKHGNFNLNIKCNGDLKVDEHHTIEDVGLVLGEAFKKALGDKKGIERYAWERILVMDEAKTELSLDLSGRPYLVFDATFEREYVGDMPTEMIEHFFQSFCVQSGANMNIKIKGKNTHHMIESCFKAFAKCLRDAVRITGVGVVSTKGAI